MISCTLLIWIGVTLDMPFSYFVLLGIGAFLKVIAFGYNIAKNALENK